MSKKKRRLEWRVHTPRLMEEILSNQGCSILRIPLRIFSNLLGQVAERSSELNDKKLNSLMAKLALYEVTDPYSKEYDERVTSKLIAGKIGRDIK